MSRQRMQLRFGQGKITPGAMWLLFASAGASLVFLMAGDDIRRELLTWFVATGDSVWGQLKVWQVVTSPLIETDFISLLFQGFMLWMFLPALERWWGKKRFLLFALYTSVTGVVVGTAVGALLSHPDAAYPIAGLDAFIFAGIVAYGVLFSKQPVQFFGVLPMTGKQLTIGIVAFVGLFLIIGQRWAEGASWAAAMTLALMMTSDHGSPKLWRLKWKQRRIRRHLRIVREEDEKTKKRWLN